MTIYIKTKTKLNTLTTKNLFNISVQLYGMYNVYIYISFIKFTKLNSHKWDFPTYRLDKQINVSKNIYAINTLNEGGKQVLIKDTLYKKHLIIESTYKQLKNTSYKRSLINPNTSTSLIHRTFNTNVYQGEPINIVVNSNPYTHTFISSLKSTLKYYNDWCSDKLDRVILNKFKKKEINLNNNKLNDITSGLAYIECIFEPKNSLNTYAITPVIGILQNSFLNYNNTIKNYIWMFNVLSVHNKQNLYFTARINRNFNLYENKYSILAPQYILTTGIYSINQLLYKIYATNLDFHTQEQAYKNSSIFIFNLLVESLTKQYCNNNIYIPSIHFEIIAKKMTSFVKLYNIGDSSFKQHDIIEFNIISSLNYIYNGLGYQQILYTPLVLGVSKSIQASSGFLTSISFQEILKNVLKYSLSHSTDWLTTLKSKIITTDVINTGSGWYRHFTSV